MIARLTGTLTKKSPARQVLDVQGVGYAIHTSLATFYALPETGQRVTLNIHTHVREDILKLFGFSTSREQNMFEKLILVSKIGPKLALNILSGIPIPELEAAILTSDAQKLSMIPGVGKKTAARLAMELKDKIQTPVPCKEAGLGRSPLEGGAYEGGITADAISALTNLGFHREKAQNAVLKVSREKNEEELDIEQLIRESLKVLVK